MRPALIVLAVTVLLAACTTDDGDEAADRDDRAPTGEDAPIDERLGTGDGYVDRATLTTRSHDYLAAATTDFDPGSPLSVIAHAERASRDGEFTFDAAEVTPEAFADLFAEIDGFEDTTDFDLLYLMNLWYGYRDRLPEDTVAATEDRFLAFKYWYTEPTPEGVVDDKYYWSENHRLIFHTVEYLAGLAFPDATFTNDGRTGAEHRDEARARILEWLDEKVRFGFTEWHSDVYYQKDLTPLLSLVEWADDEELARRSAMVLDLVLFDLASHLQEGNFGATHGRSYMKDKSRATDQDTFALAKLLFDDTVQPYWGVDAGAVLFSRARGYRPPEVLARVAASEETTVDRHRMGVPLDPLAPVEPDPEAPYGYDFDEPDNVPFWWERGAQTAWQVVPLTLDTLDRHELWDSQFYAPFQPLRDLVGDADQAAQDLAQALAPVLAFGLLSEVDTYTYRSPDVMLSTAQDPAPGCSASSITSGRPPWTRTPSSSPPTPRPSPSAAPSGPTATATGPVRGPCPGLLSTGPRRSTSTPRSTRPASRCPTSATSTTPTPTSPVSASTRSSRRTGGRSGGGATATWRCGRCARPSSASTRRTCSPAG